MSFTSGQRSAFVTSAVPGSKAFFRFLHDSDGAELLSILEQSGRLLFHVSTAGLVVEHDPQISVQQVATILQQKWKEIFMKKALQISLLNQQCTTSKTIVFPLSQAALILYYRYQIIREHKIVDLLVDSSGTVSWYGQYDCVAGATRHIMALVQEHFSDKTVQAAPELYSDPVSKNNAANMGSTMNDSYGFPNLGNLSLGLSALAGAQSSWNPEELLRCLTGTASTYSLMQQASGDATNTTQLPSNLPETFKRERAAPRVSLTGSVSSQKKRERIYFMVPSTDAPRLIGTRGVNKKRIEEQTGCSITLHTESKKDGEFPVEIIGASLSVCERAKLHIEKFLASNGNSDEKKERSKPKVHLEFSPRKTQPSSSPQKSEVDENSNWDNDVEQSHDPPGLADSETRRRVKIIKGEGLLNQEATGRIPIVIVPAQKGRTATLLMYRDLAPMFESEREGENCEKAAGQWTSYPKPADLEHDSWPEPEAVHPEPATNQKRCPSQADYSCLQGSYRLWDADRSEGQPQPRYQGSYAEEMNYDQ